MFGGSGSGAAAQGSEARYAPHMTEYPPQWPSDSSRQTVNDQAEGEDEYDPFQIRPEADEYGYEHHRPKTAYTGFSAELPRSKSRSLLYILGGWWQELVWCLVSVGTLVALVLVLERFDGEPLPRWSSGITLNTVVALLATICRLAFISPVMEGVAQYKWLWFKRSGRPLRDWIVFDKASRGPWGSVQLVFTTKAGALGILPALLLISALLTATITQSAITYPERQIPNRGHGLATMRRSSAYFWATAHQQSVIAEEAPIAAAIPRALNTPPSEHLPFGSPACRGSNCTWDEFSTLAVCVEMRNVTDRLHIDRGKDIGNIPLANLTLPNNITMEKTNYGYGDFWINTGDSISFKNGTQINKATIFDFFAVKLEVGPPDMRIRATEIALHWCINTYNVAITDNIPSLKLVASDTDVHFGEAAIPGWNTAPNVTYLTSSKDEGTKYPADGYGIGSISRILGENLVGHFVDVGAPNYTFGAGLFAAAMHPMLLHVNVTDIEAVDKAEWAAMRNMSQNIANSLTNVVLNTDVNGTMLGNEVYVHVRWEWLSMLVAQVAIGILTLVFVMVATARSGIEIIKSSPLPALFAISAEEKAELETEQHMKPLGEAHDTRLLAAAGVVGGLRRKGKLWEIR